jgi:hypothetical protein
VFVATQTLAHTTLGSLVEGFDRDAPGSRSRIRELLDRDPPGFHDAIVPILKSFNSSRGIQFVIRLLIANEALLPILCNPALNLAEAVALARTALQLDPMTDVNLAKGLADAAAQGMPVPHAGRLLDILGTISTGNRITPSLMRLLRNSDPQMRSKAVLLIGRSKQSVKWVQSRMAEPDPRTRANAVEALWGVDNAEAKELLRGASRDGNNRVAGNALYALYCMGDTWVFLELLRMAASESPLFRSSAAWAMGQTCDPRFSETLGRMLGESNGSVRKRAFAALSRLKASGVKTRQGSVWRVAGFQLPPSGSQRQIRLEVGPTEGTDGPKLLPTQFILSADGQSVTQYQVETLAAAETLAVTFLFPRTADSGSAPWVQGAIDSLPWRRPSDLWCSTFYVPDGGDAPAASPGPPQFTAQHESAAEALQKPPAVMECPSFWASLRNSVQSANAPARGARHLIAYHQSSATAPPDMAAITSAAMASNTAVHAISLAPSAPLEELCRRTNGSFHLAVSEAESSKLVGEAHLSLLSRFLVSYQPDPGARELTVRAFDATGWGEIKIPL